MVKVQNGGSFWVGEISNVFGVLEIPDIFLGWTVDAGPEPTDEDKMRVPPIGFYHYLWRSQYQNS